MRIIDITGVIKKDMWNYEAPFPKFDMRPLGKVPWVDGEVYCEVFEGLHSQTGTYLETPAHYFGNDQCYLIADIPVGKLVEIPCTVLNIGGIQLDNPIKRTPVTKEMLERCTDGTDIPEGSAILIGTGWGKHWMDPCYLELSPYFTYDAMLWLISKEPFLLGSDIPRWENLDKPQGFFKAFFTADILMLAPCINLEKIVKSTCRLTALPLNIPGTSAVPCRAIVIEEGE